ncbi:hypothetical protein, partial [Mycobacteroides abscessus]|uniref:hypothetical protein n=1 Tax=Mycobacteroides abscessus TaxID=36809 RepID=UPI000ADE0D6A
MIAAYREPDKKAGRIAQILAVPLASVAPSGVREVSAHSRPVREAGNICATLGFATLTTTPPGR